MSTENTEAGEGVLRGDPPLQHCLKLPDGRPRFFEPDPERVLVLTRWGSGIVKEKKD